MSAGECSYGAVGAVPSLGALPAGVVSAAVTPAGFESVAAAGLTALSVSIVVSVTCVEKLGYSDVCPYTNTEVGEKSIAKLVSLVRLRPTSTPAPSSGMLNSAFVAYVVSVLPVSYA